MISHSINKLKNGLTLITAPMHDTKTVTVLVFVGVGSRFETNKQAGTSHFLEHMFFKGTKNRPTYREIARELDVLGGEFNAFTGKEYTGYYVHAAADAFPKALDILQDMFFNALFEQKEIDREKGVIIEEINMYEDQPMSKVAESTEELLLGKNDLGRPIIGYKDTVNAVTSESIRSYRDTMYHPENTYVIIAGAEQNFNWQESITKYFESWNGKYRPEFSKWQSDQTTPRHTIIKRDTDQAHFVLSFPTFPITDSRRSTLRVLANLLGGMMSSRLFEEIREKRGLAYYVRSGIDDFHDGGIFSISSGVVVGKIEEALRVTLSELELLAGKQPEEEEISRSKENLKGNIYLGLEDSQSVAQYLANQILYYGEIHQPEERVAQIEAVQTSEITKLAKELFVKNQRTLGVIGPFEDDTNFKKIIES